MAAAHHFCELCGVRIEGKPNRVFIEGAVFIVCGGCVKYGGKELPMIDRRPPSSIGARQTRGVKPSPRPRRFEEMYEVVEGYAKLVYEARDSFGLTRELLASQIGEKESVVKRIESGRMVPPIELARKLERVLKVKLLRPIEEAPPFKTPPQSTRGPGLTLGDVATFKKKEAKA